MFYSKYKVNLKNSSQIHIQTFFPVLFLKEPGMFGMPAAIFFFRNSSRKKCCVEITDKLFPCIFYSWSKPLSVSLTLCI